MNRLREMATWNIRPAIELHIFKRYIWKTIGFTCLVVSLIAIVIGGFLI